MLSRLYNIYKITTESLFYLPAMICFFYGAGFLGLYLLESVYWPERFTSPLYYNGTLDDAKTIIETLLSAMITMTTLVISVTMVVLSLSASQLGPRLMKTFMRDRTTKIFIGMFFGSIAACFILLGMMQAATQESDLPRLSMSAVFVVCFSNLFILLAYVQHVAKLSIADQAIDRVYNELFTSIERMKAPEQKPGKTSDPALPKDYDKARKSITNASNGYVQMIDYPALKNLACKHDLLIEIKAKAGDFFIHGMTLAYVYPAKEATPEVLKAVENTVIYGKARTSSQDIEYSVRHLVEVGLRALSPGINDNFTALTVIDKLTAALGLLFNKGLAPHVYYDDKNRLRVIGHAYDEAQIIYDAFSQIRNAGQEKPDILHKMINRIGILRTLSQKPAQDKALSYQLACIEDHIKTHFSKTEAGKRLQAALKKAAR